MLCAVGFSMCYSVVFRPCLVYVGRESTTIRRSVPPVQLLVQRLRGCGTPKAYPHQRRTVLMPPKSNPTGGHPKLSNFWPQSNREEESVVKRPRDSPLSTSTTTTTTVPLPSASSQHDCPVVPHIRRGDGGPVSSFPCKYFASGACRDGASCRYSHGVSRAAVALPHASSSVQRCKYYASASGCRSGQACPDLHYNDFGFGVLHLPWSMQNTYIGPTGKRLSHWNLVAEQLFESRINNTSDLTEFLVDLLPPPPAGAMKHKVFPTDFQELTTVVDEIMSAAESARFFHHILPFIKNIALRCPSLFSNQTDGSIPILRQGVPGVVRLSEVQVLGLLACAFLCLFPGRHRTYAKEQFLGNAGLEKHCGKLGFVNFGSLFGFHQPQARQKIRCFIAYFETQYERRTILGLAGSAATTGPLPPMMHIEIIRTVLSPECHRADSVFACCKNHLSEVGISPTGVIEDAHGALEADFANHVLGGGVLARGCVQEEIRFAICPELMLSRLICECLRSDEAVIMNGAATFSHYTGYASTFQFAGRATIPSPTEQEASLGMRNISVVAFDAVNYCQGNLQPGHQYLVPWQDRDMIKALAAFSGSPLSTLTCASSGPIATGNWGCGAFGGDVELKLIQQWIVASFLSRPLQYFTFGNESLCTNFAAVRACLQRAHCSVGDLYQAIIMYSTSRRVVGDDRLLRRRSSTNLSRAASASAVTETVLPPAVASSVPLDDDVTLEEMLALDESTEDFLLAHEEGAQPIPATTTRPQTVFEYLLDQFSS